MSEVKEYKCPSCGAPMYYDVKQRKMTCRFCKNTFDTEYIRSHFKDEDDKGSDFDWVKRSKAVWEPYQSDKIEEFDCPSCGGKIITASSTGTAKCPFCNHDVIISSDFKGDIRPDKIIPFKISKKEFVDKYMEYISNIKYVPREFKDKSIINNVTGCYIPVWGYSCTCDSAVDSQFCSSVTVKDYPILANDKSIKFDAFYSLWPFSFSGSDDFSESYLTGFYASRYTIGAENAMRDADYRIKEACHVKKIRSENGISDPETADVKKILHNRELTYYLVPVWLLNITYQKANYTIAMNGQTGKMRVDNLPDDPLYFSSFKKIYLIIQIIELVLGYLFLRYIDKQVDFELFEFIVLLIGLCVVFPVVINLVLTTKICNLLFRRKRKPSDLIENNRFFKVDDFLE